MTWSLAYSFDKTVESAYILYLPSQPISLEYSERCRQSCEDVGMPVQLWPGADATGGTIELPANLQKDYIPWFKPQDPSLDRWDIAVILGHISLWAHCLTIDQPIVILEHDTMMLRPYREHPYHNAIVYLGCADGDPPGPAPPLSMRRYNKNGNCNAPNMYKAHAYALDPLAAKRLLVILLDRGIYETIDTMLRINDIAIVYQGRYAQDVPGESMVKNRK